MNQVLIPVLLLATASVSSSNVLPFLPTNQMQRQSFGLRSQQNDNIFSNRQNSRSILDDILYKIPIETPDDGQIELKKYIYNVNLDNNKPEDNDNKYNIINKNEKHNGDGFRKEQWHNYPRQLDRLHKYTYEQYNFDKRNIESDEPGNEEADAQQMQYSQSVDGITNEFRVDTDADSHNIYDALVATTNPLLIFKIRLACLNNNIRNSNANHYPLILEQNENEWKGEDERFNADINNLDAKNPILDIIKVKRTTLAKNKDNKFENNHPGNKAVTKRIFSLWSRLQSLNHKGHELLHRRHLHAFYGMPDNDGGGVLTAETRATLMRPPGSPLRWG